ncbi:MAG: DNA polymerase I [Bacteroidota bacterium]
MSQSKKLFLLDAMALIYRSHFALSNNPIVNSKGVNTGAILGFSNALYEIITKEAPTHIGVAFDTEAPTFRHTEYKEYKANRERQPEEIEVAIPYCKKIIEGFGIPILEKDGFEADDIIGTLAKRAARAGFSVYMMTPDKDFAQLVEEQIFLYKPARMGNAVEVLGPNEVLKKFDIRYVHQVIDVLGLKGDAIDNIPGIPGIGDKTASKLLHQYESVEDIVTHVEELKGSLKKKIEEFGDQGILSKQLATINIEVDIPFDEEKLTYSGPNDELLVPVFDELEFRTLSKRVFGGETAMKKAADKAQLGLFEEAAPEQQPDTIKKSIDSFETDYQVIDSESALQKLIELLQAQGEFCFDTETTSLETVEAEIVGIAFSVKALQAFYVPFPDTPDEAKELLQEFKAVFENPSIRKIGQNLKYDMQILRNYDVHIRGEIFDTMLAHYLIEPEAAHNMDVLADKYLHYVPISIESLIGPKGKRQKSMRDVPLDQVARYAAEDADITLQLKEKISRDIDERDLHKLLHDVEQPLSFVLADMEYEGVSIDPEALHDMSEELGELSETIQRQIFELAGESFNIGSPKQLGVILFEKLQLLDKPKKTKTGQYATGEDVLSKLAAEHEIASKILEFREYQKLKSTYVDALPKLVSPRDSRVHTDYRQTVAATGRLSSNNPNLQNIPIRTAKGREIRKAFVPKNDEYVILSADYSQIELRIMAAFSGDDSMIGAFKEGRDIHANTASKVFKVPLEEVDPNMRRKAKEVNFGIIYGISAFGLSQNLNIPRGEAQEIITSYFQEFPAVKAYMDNAVTEAKERHYVTTILGRRRYLRNINSRNFTTRGFDERNAVNAPIQGSAADMIKVAMINIHQLMRKEKMQSKMIMQVHDELVFEAHHEELDFLQQQVTELMKTAIELNVPMEVGIGSGKNWLEAH